MTTRTTKDVTTTTFLVEDLIWLHEFLTNFADEGGPMDFMTTHMEIAKGSGRTIT